MSKKNKLSYGQWKELVYGSDNNLLGDLLAQWEMIFTSVFVWDTSSTGSKDLGRYIELYLYSLGTVVFFNNKQSGGYSVLPFASQGGINIYGEQTKWKVIGANGFNQEVNDTDAVRIRNNARSMSYLPYVAKQVKRLVNIEGAIDTNINQLKVPIIFSGDEQSLLTMKNIYKKIVDNDPVVYVDKRLEINKDFKGVPTGVNYHGQELSVMYNDIEGRLLKIAGLKYVHTEKKERLVVDEVNSNDGLSNTFLHSALQERILACEKINEMFGLNISVDINPLLKLTDPNKDGESEGDNGDEE